ncbi:Cacna1d [Symbiodinium natans]|uniref:Cacna1d protein n=1 Tax=Symbiodinium natans TaxID=878477 RepID=A0A812RQF6_9DINO|nr:Cacna1d [Symbiodinium natans]
MEQVKPPPVVDLLALPTEDRRPSTSSSRASQASSPASTPRQDHRAFGSLPAIPDSDGAGEESHNGAASAADAATRPPRRVVKIGDTEEIDGESNNSSTRLASPQGARPRTRSSDSSYVPVKVTPTGRRMSTADTTLVMNSSPQLNDRLSKVFCVQEPQSKVITGPELAAVMQRNRRFAPRKDKGEFTKERMEDIIRELRVIASRLRGESPKRSVNQQNVMSWLSFVELMSIPDLATQARPEMVQAGVQLGQDTAHGTSGAGLSNANDEIELSISEGFSMDYDPGWMGWTLLEMVFATVFVIEVVVKLVVLSPRVYFTGTDYAWNIGDLVLTLVAVVDVIISTTAASAGSARMSMVLRGLRLSRVARLIKLMHWPLLAELANMISAMVIGVPWLFWVTILLCGVLYVCAIVLRSTVSSDATAMFERCGSADNEAFPLPGEDPRDGCVIAHLYLGEYCGTVFTCMFTVFRCLIGDCNSKGGRPLAAVMSNYYGWTFEGFYGLSMVTMIFGMTNIITAMFVDATLSGLKYNDVQRKHAKLHETNYVTRKLNELVVRVSKTVREMREADKFEDSQSNWRKSFKSFLRKGSVKISDSDLDRELTLSEAEFTQVLQNSKIRNLLDETRLQAVRVMLGFYFPFEDLDIELEARPGIFEAFGADADGHLGVSELVWSHEARSSTSTVWLSDGSCEKHQGYEVSAQMSLQTIGEKLNVFQASCAKSRKSDLHVFT